MKFEPVDPQHLTIESDRYTISPTLESDAEDVFRLLTDSRLTFLDSGGPPTDVDQMRNSIRSARQNRRVHDDLIHHEWIVRAKPGGALVAVASCDVMRKSEVRPVKNADDQMTGVAEHEAIAVEPTIYVHPDHQGRGYGSAVVDTIERLAHELYGATMSALRVSVGTAGSEDRWGGPVRPCRFAGAE